jgi:hypothetical protein
MTVQPYIVLGESQQVSLQASLSADLATWAASWFARDEALSLQIKLITQISDFAEASDAIRIEGSTEDQWAVYAFDSANSQQLGALVIGEQEPLAPTNLLCKLERSALLDLVERLLGREEEGVFVEAHAGRLDSCIPEGAFKPGRGILQLTVALARSYFYLWLPVLPLLPRIILPTGSRNDEKTRPVAPKKALAHQKVSGWVVLGEAELTIDALAQLKLGDVISLDKNLTEPMTMIIEKSAAGFSGYLGQKGDRLVFRVQAPL